MNYFSSLLNAMPGIINLGLIYGIAAIGVFITFKILDFADLTVDGSFATGGAVFAVLTVAGVNIIISLLIAFLAGAVAGLITALIHCYLGIPGILSGILTQLMLWSINLVILGKANQPIMSRGALISASSTITSIGILLGITALTVGVLYWFFGTRYGASVRSAGSNPAMSKANGISVNNRKIIALMISNGLVALGGALYAQYNGAADINNGRGFIVIALAAIIIGGAIVKKWGKNFAIQLSAVAVGGIIYYFVYQAIALIKGVNTEWLKMLSAVVVVIFLAIPYIKTHYWADLKAKFNRNKEAK